MKSMLMAAARAVVGPATAQNIEKSNVLLIVSDDTGQGDLGTYLGGVERGMPTPTSTSSQIRA